jgi:hypothetical protein
MPQITGTRRIMAMLRITKIHLLLLRWARATATVRVMLVPALHRARPPPRPMTTCRLTGMLTCTPSANHPTRR